MTLSAHKKFLVTVVEAKEDGELHTINGTIPVRKGELIAHNQFGEPSIMTRDYYERNYISVEKVKKQKKFVKSPFEEAYEKQLIEFNNLEFNSLEDEQYIEGTRELHKNENN
jgi:hypothetical protein